jgi:hypothetical protein
LEGELPLTNSTPQLTFVRFLKLFAIAIGSFFLIGIVVVVSAKTGIEIPARWFGLGAWTCGLIWFLVRTYKQHLHRATFWGIVLTLLIFHLGAFTFILREYPHWQLGWFILPCFSEAVLTITVIEKVLHRQRG